MSAKQMCRNCKHFGIDGALMCCRFIKEDVQHVRADNVCTQWKRMAIIEVA